MEDPYDEVKRFSDLTEDEVDTVVKNLRGVSSKFATMFRPEIRGGEEDRKFLKDLEKLVTSVDLIFLVMPLTEEFQKKKNEVEQRSQSHHSASPSMRAISEVDERRQLQRSEVGPAQENFGKQIKKTKKIFHTSTDNSAAEDNKTEERQKPKKKQHNKQSAISDSSTEEEEEAELISPVKNRSNIKTSVTPKRSTKEARTQQKEGSVPAQNTKNKNIDTRLLNGFLQRASAQKAMISENKQTEARKIKYWVGTENFPIVDHAEDQDEENLGPRQYQEKLSWWEGITTAIWLLWVAIFTGIYPIYQTGSPSEQTIDQTTKETQTKGQESAEQPELQVPNQRYKRLRNNLLEKQKIKNPGEKSNMQ